MSSNNDPYASNTGSKTVGILVVLLLVIVALVVVLLIFFKPETQAFDTTTGDIKSTPEQHIESLDPLIRETYKLSEELNLFDRLFDELVYAETPDVNLIGDFVSHYHNYAKSYSADRDKWRSLQTLPVSTDTSLISFDVQQKLLKESIATLLESIDKKEKVFMTIPVKSPIDREFARIASGFGMRDHPILNERRMHSGIDIAAPEGTEVRATASGKVISTEDQKGYGRKCIVEHKFGYQTVYGHMCRLRAGENTWVKKGDVVGIVGNTGLSVATHLHYEVRKNGKPLNPSYFIFEGLTTEEYKEVIELGSKTDEILSF